jgi:hypothetical protein
MAIGLDGAVALVTGGAAFAREASTSPRRRIKSVPRVDIAGRK